MILHRLLEALSNPLCWGLLIIMSVGLYLIVNAPKKSGMRECGVLLLCAFLSLYAITTPWLPNQMLSHLETQYSKVTTVNPAVQWVVVLGGGVLQSSTLSVSDSLENASLKRALEGIRLYQLHPNAKLVLSGGLDEHKTHAEAKHLDALAAWLQVPDDKRVLEVNSQNTKAQAQEIKSIVGEAPFYLVTSASHMPRAMQLFWHEGMHPIAAPCDFVIYKKEIKEAVNLSFIPDAKNLMKFNSAWHEYLGMLWALIRGHI